MLYTRVKKKQQYLNNLPSKPGIYRFYNSNNEIIYVGASSNLRKRVKQHFVNLTNGNRIFHSIRRSTKFIEYICYNTVASAFEAEKVEIWTHKPKYNRRGVIIKAFSYLIIRKSPFLQFICVPSSDYEKIDEEDEFYRFNLHYLQLQRNLGAIRKQIPLCLPSSVCWDHHLGLCFNSCRIDNSEVNEQYLTQIELFIQAISGSRETLTAEWEMNQKKYLEILDFEAAKRLNDALKSLKELKLKFCGKGFTRDTDQFVFEKIDSTRNFVRLSCYRRGEVISEVFDEIEINRCMDQEHNILNYLLDFYKNSCFIPQNIQINVRLSSSLKISFQQWLKRYYGKLVSINKHN